MLANASGVSVRILHFLLHSLTLPFLPARYLLSSFRQQQPPCKRIPFQCKQHEHATADVHLHGRWCAGEKIKKRGSESWRRSPVRKAHGG